jgi:hypothetical protein
MLNLLALFGLAPTHTTTPVAEPPQIAAPPPSPPRPVAAMTAAQWYAATGVTPAQDVRRRVGRGIIERTGAYGTWDQAFYNFVLPAPEIARAVGIAQADVQLRRAAANTRRRERRIAQAAGGRHD